MAQLAIQSLYGSRITLQTHLSTPTGPRRTPSRLFHSYGEAKRDEFVSPFLISVINSFDEPALKLLPQRRIEGSTGKGPVDYTIEYKGKVICATECKATEVAQRILQNLAQLNSAAEENTRNRNRKLPEDTDEQKREALYGIVSTGDVWRFLMFLFSDGNVQVAVSEQLEVMRQGREGEQQVMYINMLFCC